MMSAGVYHEYFVNRNIGQCLQSILGKLPAARSLSASNLRSRIPNKGNFDVSV